MSTETLIQAAIVRVDLFLCAIGRALLSFGIMTLCVVAIIAIDRLFWRLVYDRHRPRRH